MEVHGRLRRRLSIQGFIQGSGIWEGLHLSVHHGRNGQFVQFFIRCRFIPPQTVLELPLVEYLVIPRLPMCAGVDAYIGFTNIADLALNGSSGEVNNNFVTDLVINSFFRRNVNNFILLLFIQFPDMGQPLNPEDGLSAVGQVHILQADGFEHKVDVVYTEVPAIQLDDAADRQIIFLPQMFCLMVGAIFTLSGQIDAVALGPQFLRFCYPLSTQKASHFDFSQRVFL